MDMDVEKCEPKRGVSELKIMVEVKASSLTELQDWWKGMSEASRSLFKENFGKVAEIMTVRPDWDVLKALVHFYNPKMRCFSFGDFDLSPTVEEYSNILGELHSKDMYVPDERLLNVDEETMKLMLADYLRVPLGDVKKYVRNNGKTCGLMWNQFYEKVRGSVGNSKSFDAKMFALGLFGLVLLPSVKGCVDSAVILALYQSEKGLNFAPAILAETFRELQHVRDNRRGQFRFCTQLLTVWLHSHLAENASMFPTRYCQDPISKFNAYMQGKAKKRTLEHWKHFFSGLKSEGVLWVVKPFSAFRYVRSCGPFPWVPLMGIRGLTSYAPLLVARQFGDRQEIVDLKHLDELHFSYQEPESKVKLIQVIKAWQEPLFRKSLCEEEHPEYQAWRKDYVVNDYKPAIQEDEQVSAIVKELNSIIAAQQRQIQEMQNEARHNETMFRRTTTQRDEDILELEGKLHAATKANQKIQRENEFLEEEVRDVVLLKQSPYLSNTVSRRWALMKEQLRKKKKRIIELTNRVGDLEKRNIEVEESLVFAQNRIDYADNKIETLERSNADLRIALEREQGVDAELLNLRAEAERGRVVAAALANLELAFDNQERKLRELQKDYKDLDYQDSCLHKEFEEEKKKVSLMRDIMLKNHNKAMWGLEVARAIYHDSKIALTSGDAETSFQRHSANILRLEEFYEFAK